MPFPLSLFHHLSSLNLLLSTLFSPHITYPSSLTTYVSFLSSPIFPPFQSYATNFHLTTLLYLYYIKPLPSSFIPLPLL
jgi:hypothetical protein